VFEFDDSGQIVSWREYWDALDIAAQLGLTPDEMKRLHGITD
jgi:limonene-1,2-epoxide hydrolase